MAPKISIVIPVYNSAKYLRECLDSICNQSFEDWEIIAIDDGCRDESAAILDEYADHDKRIRVIHKANGGVSAARNDGLSAAIGEYVLFVDSDDWLEAEALLIYWDEACRVNADVVIADHNSIYESGLVKRYKFFSQNFVTSDRDMIDKLQQTMLYGSFSPYYSENCGYLFAALWTKLFRREILIENHVEFSTNISLYEDGMFDLYAFEFVKTVAYVQKPLYNYRILNSSLCHSYKYNSLDLYKRISEEILRFLKSRKKTTAFENAYETRFVYYAKKQIGQLFSSNLSFFAKYRECRRLLTCDFYDGFLRKIPTMNLVKNEKTFGRLVSCKMFFLLSLLMQIRRG